MCEVSIISRAEVTETDRPMLRLKVRGHEIEATFATDERPSLFPLVQDILFDAYLRSMGEIPPAC